MKTLVLVLLFTTACFADFSVTVTVAPSAADTGSTSMVHSPSAAPSSASPSPSMAPSVSPSQSIAPSVSPSQSMAPSVSPSQSMSPSVSPSQSISPSASASASMSPSMSISPSASSSAAPATSRVPTTNPPTTNPTTTTPKIHYNVDVQVEDEYTGKPCLWFKASMNVTYKYKNVSGQIILSGKDATISGECSNFTKVNETSEVTLTWPEGVISTMTVEFKAGSTDDWFFSKVGVVLDITYSANEQVVANKTFKGDQNTEFLHASQNKSYSCTLEDKVKLKSKQGANVTLNFIDIMVQPFAHNNTLVDPKATDSCSSKSKSSKSSSIVPIAVGCALAGLIVIVLIAYLIGRRKNDGRGYQQV